jgi:GDP/UDP-N,N'-diacetylbacillosamine 2-epimerase (hydrolysing)
MKRKICIITGSRAEYGLLKPLLDEIKSDPDLSLQLIVTGMHLSPEFGLTFSEIEKDGFRIDNKIEILLSSDTATGTLKSMGLALMGFGEAYERLRPDIIVVLGDRFEIFSAAASALVSEIPVAHIHGGEVTEGAFDDAFRHSITKMSHLHFTSTEEYRKRVIQLGEAPERVFDVGAIGLDNVKRLKLLSKKELENKLNFKFAKRNLLVTFHPVTLENTTEKQFKNLLTVLNELKDTKIIFTKTNADPGGMTINRIIDEYVVKNPQKAVSFISMGQLNYLSTMQFVDAVVGNSSSGIVEAPSFKIGTINIGNRQEGRIKAESIIDCEPTKESIKKALQELYSSDFQEKLKNIVNPYSDGNTARRILKVLKAYDIRNILKKTFYDINFEYKTTVM